MVVYLLTLSWGGKVPDEIRAEAGVSLIAFCLASIKPGSPQPGSLQTKTLDEQGQQQSASRWIPMFFGGASAGLAIKTNMNIALGPISNRSSVVGRLLGQLTRVINEMSPHPTTG